VDPRFRRKREPRNKVLHFDGRHPIGSSRLCLLRCWKLEDAEQNLIRLKKRIVGLSESTLERFVLRARYALRMKGIVDVLVTTSREIQGLNRRFRSKNVPTDVLSFPAWGAAKSHPAFAGDIVISAEIASRNAHRLGHSAADEVKILALHGMLHLAGYDHESDNGRMARKEINLRREFGLPTALIERSEQEAGIGGVPARTPRKRRGTAVPQRRR
jgi:probable rRNA maturation factor